MPTLYSTADLNLSSLSLQLIIFHLYKEHWILMGKILLEYAFSCHKDSSIVNHTKTTAMSF